MNRMFGINQIEAVLSGYHDLRFASPARRPVVGPVSKMLRTGAPSRVFRRIIVFSMCVMSLGAGCSDTGSTSWTVREPIDVGDVPVSVPILARPQWNDTGIMVHQGVVYQVVARGRWYDGSQPAGPTGYDSLVLSWAERWRRSPPDRWFALICSVDRDEDHLVSVAAGAEHSFIKSGQLTCFANDWWMMYWNNWGYVEMTIRRLRVP